MESVTERLERVLPQRIDEVVALGREVVADAERSVCEAIFVDLGGPDFFYTAPIPCSLSKGHTGDHWGATGAPFGAVSWSASQP